MAQRSGTSNAFRTFNQIKGKDVLQTNLQSKRTADLDDEQKNLQFDNYSVSRPVSMDGIRIRQGKRQVYLKKASQFFNDIEQW